MVRIGERENYLNSQQIQKGQQTDSQTAQLSAMSTTLTAQQRAQRAITHTSAQRTQRPQSQRVSLPTIGNSYSKISKRIQVESFLLKKIEEEGINFEYFITLSSYKPTRDVGSCRKDNAFIKRVILDFFYSKSGKKKADRMRLWFFNERHADGDIHLHILMEGISQQCRERVSRRIFIDTDGVCETLDDNAILGALTKHLKRHVKRLGNGHQAVDCREIGILEERIHYVNKSMEGTDFEGIDHIDFVNSDF